ncbi:hypothetical protein ABIF69_004495 [Bradyrhizobium japonicum]
MRAEIVRETLREIFEHAEWRAAHSRDRRSASAAKSLRRLVRTAHKIEPEVLVVYAELWEGEADQSAHRKLLDSVGYGFFPLSAREFVSRFIADRTGASTPSTRLS